MPTHRIDDSRGATRMVGEDNTAEQGIELSSEDKMEDGRVTPPNDSRDEKER